VRAVPVLHERRLFLTHSEDQVSCEKKLTRFKPNQLGHAGRDLAGLTLFFSPSLKKKTWCNVQSQIPMGGKRLPGPPPPFKSLTLPPARPPVSGVSSVYPPPPPW